jgi:hypothetical protein
MEDDSRGPYNASQGAKRQALRMIIDLQVLF